MPHFGDRGPAAGDGATGFGFGFGGGEDCPRLAVLPHFFEPMDLVAGWAEGVAGDPHTKLGAGTAS